MRNTARPLIYQTSTGTVVDREDRDSDGVDLVWEDEEAAEKKVDKFTCDCNFGPKSTACSILFGRELLATTCMNCRELNIAQLAFWPIYKPISIAKIRSHIEVMLPSWSNIFIPSHLM